MKFSTLVLCAAFAAAPAVFGGSIAYTITLNGANESPANASSATGSGFVIFDTTLNTMRIAMSFDGLTGNTTAAHIHCCTATAGTGTASVATQTPSFIGFPLGVKSGSFANTYDLTLASSYRAGFVTANGGSVAASQAALMAGAAAGKAYFNVHTEPSPAARFAAS